MILVQLKIQKKSVITRDEFRLVNHNIINTVMFSNARSSTTQDQWNIATETYQQREYNLTLIHKSMHII